MKHASREPNAPASVPFWMWGAVAALLIFTLYTSWEAVQLNKTIQETNAQAQAEIAKRQQLQERFALAQLEAVILTDPHSVKIPMPAISRDMPKLEAMWHAKMGIIVTGQNVPTPAGNRTLQLWLIPKTPGAKPMPSMTVRPDADGKFMLLVANPPGNLESTKALAITEEPAGGSQAPTTKPLWIGAVT